MKKHFFIFKRALAAAAALAVALACAPVAFANEDPDAAAGDTLAGAFTEPEVFADTPLEAALSLEAGSEAAVQALPGNIGDANVTLNLWVCSGSNTNRTYKTGVTLSWREALAGILNAEVGGFYSSGVPQSAVKEAWKAQAVAIHSYLLYNGCSTNQSTSEFWLQADASTAQGRLLYAAADEALCYLAVTGQGVEPQNYSMALTSYYASAGYNPDTGARGTANCRDVWQQDLSYLVGVASPYDEDYCAKLGLTWAHSKYNYTRWNELASELSRLYGADIGSYWSRGDTSALQVTERSTYGYVTHTGLRAGDSYGLDGQKLYTGFRGTNWTVGLASGSYKIEYVPGNKVTESGLGTVEEPWHLVAYGSGHGVGLSQVGALGYAANGWSAWQILAHYYQGIRLYNTADGLLYIPSESTAGLISAAPIATGDANADGSVDLRDVLTLSSALSGRTQLSPTGALLVDLNASGSADEADLTALVDLLLQ